MLRICIWMDVPSHYQRAFFTALEARGDVDLVVCYTKPVSERRAAQGWSSDFSFKENEYSVAGVQDPAKMLAEVPDGNDRIHLICSHFSRALIKLFCERGVQWCHWSEMPGIRLAESLGYRMWLFRLLNPFVLSLKRIDGWRMAKYSKVVFGQGMLADQSFRLMGVPKNKIANLFYVPAPLEAMSPSEEIFDFAKGCKVFLSVGALCPRKGIDVLLKAFSRIPGDGWCLVLCGLDNSGGQYESLAESLGIQDRVLFLGAYPVEKIAGVYAASDVFVLASRFDGWGAVFNEATSLGMPVVGTDLCGGTWHLVEDGKNGYRARAGSVGSLNKALMRFVNKPSLCKQFSEHSRNLFFQEFTPERNAERLVERLMQLDKV